MSFPQSDRQHHYHRPSERDKNICDTRFVPRMCAWKYDLMSKHESFVFGKGRTPVIFAFSRYALIMVLRYKTMGGLLRGRHAISRSLLRRQRLTKNAFDFERLRAATIDLHMRVPAMTTIIFSVTLSDKERCHVWMWEFGNEL